MKKKILLAMEGDRFSNSTLKYGIEIARQTDSLLVGVFMRDLKYAGYAYPIIFDQPFVDTGVYSKFMKEERQKIDANIKIFNDKCAREGVAHKVHLDEAAPIEGLIHESAYADLIIMDSKMNISDLLPDNPSSTLRDILADAHCPIMIVPTSYQEIKNIILSYDGSRSSVYAIKMFNYIFPEWSDAKTYLVNVNESKGNHLKENTNIRELMGRHYTNVTYEVMRGDVTKEIKKFMKYNYSNSIVVMGAYGRNALSRLWHQSLANMIIKDIKVPVFISHQS
jgi:nucleotide-binding universal stress UspA family protein